MAKIVCHNREQIAKIYEIVPTKRYVSSEYIICLDKCCICGKPYIEKYSFDILNKKLFIEKIKTNLIPEFLRQITKIRLCKSIGSPFPVNNKRFFLNCNVYGKIQKCYENLSNLRLGLIDPDYGLGFRNTNNFD